MQPVTKLVRQIRDALRDGRNAPMETLAADYTRLCQDASVRLESCAAMLEKGSEYQALQLAEAEPVLLDLVAALSFAEAPEWIAYCDENQLPAPARFDTKAVQALDRLYAKGISANHPLYREYRAAVTSRDDAKALHIIHSIVRLNPEDTNAKSELSRIENKFFQLKLQELRAALAQDDENAILAALSELERVGMPERLTDLPECAQANEVRREVSRRDAIALAERLADSLEEERSAGAWRMVGDLLARLRELQAEHGFALPEPASGKCAKMQQYFAAERAAAEETARFEQAIAALGGISETSHARLLSGASLSLGETQNLHHELLRRWHDVEGFQRPVSEALIEKVRTTAGLLRAELERLERRRRLAIISAGVAAVVLIAIAVWQGISSIRVQDYAAQLGSLRGAGQVDAAEKMIASVRAEHPALATKPKLAARLDEVAHWARDERNRLAEIEADLTELESSLKAEADKADPVAFSTKLESTSQLLGALANGLRAGPTSRLLVVRNQFDAHAAILREKFTADADRDLASLEKLVDSKLSYDQPKDVLTQGLAEIEPVLKSLEARARPPVAALELPSQQQARVESLRKRVDLFHEELAHLSMCEEGVFQATTTDAFILALASYKTSRLAQVQEVIDARKLLAVFPKPDDLIAGLLLPNDPVGWAAMKADISDGLLAPDTVLPAEISILVGLRDDNCLNDVWTLSVSGGRRNSAHRDLYAHGEVKLEGPNEVDGVQIIRLVGAVYDPVSNAQAPTFAPTTVSLPGESVIKHMSGASECLSHLELNRMTDAAGAQFERPILAVFDDLVRDKSADALSKAYLMQQLGLAMKVRTYAWGLEYCNSLRDDLAELARICEGATLHSHDWMIERKRTQYGAKLTAFFAGLQNRRYLAEARVSRDIVRNILRAGLRFGGFVDSTGQPHLLGEAKSMKALWVLTPDGQRLTRYMAAVDGSQRPKTDAIAWLSPIVYVPLDRDALLADAIRKMSGGSGGTPKLPAIPWLETP